MAMQLSTAPQQPSLFAQKRQRPATKGRRQSRKISTVTASHTTDKAIDDCHGQAGSSHCGQLLNNTTQLFGKVDTDCLMYLQDISDLSHQDVEFNTVFNDIKIPLDDDNEKYWTWGLEAASDDGEGSGKLVLSEFATQQQEQQALPVWMPESSFDHNLQISCSQDVDFANMFNESPISSCTRELMPAKKRSRSMASLDNLIKKETHILTERERRKSMNNLFDTVRTLIPQPTAKDKASLISDFIQHIRLLQQKIEGLKQKQSDLLASVQSPTTKLPSAHDSLSQMLVSQIAPDPSKNKVATGSIPSSGITPHPCQSSVKRYIGIHGNTQDVYVTITSVKDPRISLSIAQVMLQHQLQIVNVNISSNEASVFYNLHAKAKYGSICCKQNLHSQLQQLIGN